MTKFYKDIIKQKKAMAFLGIIMLTLIISVGSASANVCGISYGANGKINPECPNGKITRTDISPKCIEDINQNSCVDTMPVTNVSRIPEDVCHRGAGWSRKRDHQGIDYAAPLGAVVTASADGVIKRATGNIKEPGNGGSCSGYGNLIDIEHKTCDGKTYITRYAHLNRLASGIREGAKVKKGETIGYVGGTGGACGRYHLHFEMRNADNSLIDPLCGDIQQLCVCQTPIPSDDYDDCRDSVAVPSSTTPVEPIPNAPPLSYSDPAYTSDFSITGSSDTQKPQTTDTTSSVEAAEGSKKCSYQKYINNFRQWNCVFCKPFAIIFNTASIMAKSSYEALAGAVSIVMVVAFAIWAAVTTLRYVSHMETKEPRAFVKTMLNQSFRVLMVYILLQSDLLEILALTFDPVFVTGLSLAQMAGHVNPDTCDLGNINVLSEADGAGLSQEMGMGILCTIKSIQDQVGDVLALGSVSWCMSWKEKFLIFPHLGYVITGIMFYLGGFLLLFIYPFLLIDSILKLSIAIALLPAALGAFAFKVTSKYLGKIWETFLNAMFSFIFLSIIILIISSIAADYVSVLRGRDEIETNLLAILGWWLVDALKIAFVCFLGYAVLDEVKDFSGKFAGGISLQGIGVKTGSTVGAVGKWGGKKTFKYAVKPAAKSGWRWGREKWKQGGTLYTQGRGRVNAFFSGGPKVDGNGNKIYNTANLWQLAKGQKVETTFSQQNGNTSMRSVKTKKNGDVYIKTKDKFGTVHQKLDKNGNEIYTKGDVNSAKLDRLVKNDGSLRSNALNDFRQNSTLSKENQDLIIMQKLMDHHLGSNYKGAKLSDSYLKREINISKDEQGRAVTHIAQTNNDGSTSSFTLVSGDGNRAMIKVENIDNEGKGTSFATDGIIKSKSYISETRDKDGNLVERKEDERFAFSDYYTNELIKPLSSLGTFAAYVPKEKIMYSAEQIKKFTTQVNKKGNQAYRFNEFK